MEIILTRMLKKSHLDFQMYYDVMTAQYCCSSIEIHPLKMWFGSVDHFRLNRTLEQKTFLKLFRFMKCQESTQYFMIFNQFYKQNV